MPTYEYECKKCSYNFEVFQSMSEEPVKDCPKCGKEVRRLIFGGAGVIFKGSGFYVTDKNKGPSGAKPGKKPVAESGDGVSADGASGDGKKPAETASTSSGEKSPKETKEQKSTSTAGPAAEAKRHSTKTKAQ